MARTFSTKDQLIFSNRLYNYYLAMKNRATWCDVRLEIGDWLFLSIVCGLYPSHKIQKYWPFQKKMEGFEIH